MLDQLMLKIFFVKGYLNGKVGKRLPKVFLKKVQLFRFFRFKTTILSQSPFYHQYVKSPLYSLPLLNKAKHMQYFNQINTESLQLKDLMSVAVDAEMSRDFTPVCEGFSVGLSSGTSGSRGLFVTSLKEQLEWAGFIIGRVLPFSWKKKRVALFLRSNNNLYESVSGKLIQFKFFDLSKGVNENIKSLNTFRPHVLVAPPSVLAKIKDLHADVTPSQVISVAEVLDDFQKLQLEAHFDCPISQVYQCTEGFLGSSCQHGTLHLNDDVVIVEKQWVDRKTGRFSPVITDLKRRTQPIVRYLLDDILIVEDEECPCGSNLTAIKSIEGRKDDVLVLQSEDDQKVDIFPDFIRNLIVISCPEITDFQVVQYGKDLLEVRVNPLSNEITENISEALRALWKMYNVSEPLCKFSGIVDQPYTIKRRRVINACHG